MRAWRLSRLPLSLGLLAMLALIIVAALWIAPRDPLRPDIGHRLEPPSAPHPLGTDSLGRDELARLIYGTRPTLSALALVAVLMVPPGLLLGMIAGLSGGLIERALGALMNLVLAFPPLVLALALVGSLGPGLLNAALALALTGWPAYARLALAETRALKRSDYLAAAHMQGIGGLRLLWGHVLPACLPSAQIRLAFDLGATLLSIAALGFLGLGVQPPTPEWGMLVAEGAHAGFEHWWLAVFPGAAIFAVSLVCNTIADVLRDRADPRFT